MIDTSRSDERFRELLSRGFSSDADVRWFTGPSGLLAVCRAMRANGDFASLESGDFARLLEELDDRLPAFGRQMPSARAVALAVVARGVPYDRAAVVRGLLPPAGDDETNVFLAATADAVIADLDAYFADRYVVTTSDVTVPIAVSRHSRGELLLFVASRSGAGGRAPHLIDAPFQRFDLDFIAAVNDAASLADPTAGSDHGLRFSVVSARTHVPVDAIGGRSVGLGATIALRRLQTDAAPPPDPEWVFTGDIDRDGRVRSLVSGDRVQDYRRKIEAIGHRTLLFPDEDSLTLSGIADGTGFAGHLEPVTTVDHAESLIARHVAGRVAYQRALAGEAAPIGEVRPAVSRLAVVVLSAAIALAAVALIFVVRSLIESRELAAWKRQASGAALTVTPDPQSGLAPFLIDRVEVSNRQYLLCVDHGGCEDNRTQSNGDVYSNPDDPAQAMLAEDAERFCEWAHGSDWSLPTFEQWQAGVLFGSRSVWPFGDRDQADLTSAEDLPTEMRPVVAAGGTVDGELVGLVGNLAEWTRTACDNGTCRPVDEIGTNLLTLRLGGVPYSLADDSSVMVGSSWLTDPADVNFTSPTTATDPEFGFRCAHRST